MADPANPPEPDDPANPPAQPPEAPAPLPAIKPGSPWSTPAPPPPTVEPITDKDKLPKVKETGGPEGPEPTRYNDWEVKGRVSDF